MQFLHLYSCGLPSFAPFLQLAAEGLGSAWADALAVADALGAREAAGEALVLRSRLRLSALAREGPPARVAVLQWADPLYSAGGWTPALLTKVTTRRPSRHGHLIA
jgi:hypothetical protein